MLLRQCQAQYLMYITSVLVPVRNILIVCSSLSFLSIQCIDFFEEVWGEPTWQFSIIPYKDIQDLNMNDEEYEHKERPKSKGLIPIRYKKADEASQVKLFRCVL